MKKWTKELLEESGSLFCAKTIYNCVSLRHGKIMICPDDAMVGIARVHIEKEY